MEVVAIVLTVAIFVAHLAIEGERNRKADKEKSAAEFEFRNRQLGMEQRKLELDAEARRAIVEDRKEERTLAERQRQDQMDVYKEQFLNHEEGPAQSSGSIRPRVGVERASELFGEG